MLSDGDVKTIEISISSSNVTTPLYKYIYNNIIIFKPTSTKPQAGKLQKNIQKNIKTYKIMVAMAVYSVTMVLWKETAISSLQSHYYYLPSVEVREGG